MRLILQTAVGVHVFEGSVFVGGVEGGGGLTVWLPSGDQYPVSVTATTEQIAKVKRDIAECALEGEAAIELVVDAAGVSVKRALVPQRIKQPSGAW